MERLIYVPIERLNERYSAQWDDWFMKAFKNAGVDVIRVGDTQERTIKRGQFLDVIETNRYKNMQLEAIMQILEYHSPVHTTIFFMDLWFPGIEMLAYIRDGMKRPIKISGMLHAGTWDPCDFLSQQNMAPWAHHFEKSIFAIADRVFLASKFHERLIVKGGHAESLHKCEIVEWPVETEFAVREKKDLIVFPHRLAPEKQPEVFDILQGKYALKYGTGPTWIKTKDVCTTKEEYYRVLSEAKVAVSTALQETYGIAMVEAVNNGCQAVAPDRLSYREVLNGHRLYDNLDQAVDMIHNALIHYERPPKIEGKEIPWLERILL